jgi:MinD-like ATPase involved in chromosome partitioning or flagellar assembly
MASDAGEAVDAYRKLRRVVRAYLGLDMDLLAGIPRDPAVARASRLQRPLLLDQRGGSAARTLDRIGSRLADEIRHAARRAPREAS